MKLLFFTVILSLLCMACHAQQTALPPEMPANFSVSYHQGGAMARSYRKFEIEDGVLSYEELKSHGQPKILWTSKVEPAELAKLYYAFRSNAFDLIENDERDRIVHDAGSESIALSLGADKSYRVTYGHNSPLSGRDLERYRAVKKALDSLLDRHRPAKHATIENDDDPLPGTWRAAGNHGNGHTWYLQWKFAGGSFEMRGYPPIYQAGKYRIAAIEGAKLTIELYDQKGNFGEEKRTVEVLLDGANGTIKIDQMAGFRRIED